MEEPTDHPAATKSHDVAISFLARDEAIARELYDRLAGLNVFFFPRQQEDLAGTDGLESMRESFLTARLVVTLFRSPWGETNWTRVEQTAITDRCLNQGWKGLLFVQLDGTSSLPTWLPETHVRFSLEQYGIEQLAGAVKARVQELGGKIAPMDALARARVVKRDADLIADETNRFRDPSWIISNIHPQVQTIVAATAALAKKASDELGMEIVTLAEDRRCVLRDRRGFTLNIGWKQSIFNSVLEEAGLIAAEWNGPLFMPSEKLMTIGMPDEIRRVTYLPKLSLSRDLRWMATAHPKERLSGSELADALVRQFLDLLSKADQGKVQLGGWN